jgi:hypothetical protein
MCSTSLRPAIAKSTKNDKSSTSMAPFKRSRNFLVSKTSTIKKRAIVRFDIVADDYDYDYSDNYEYDDEYDDD